MMKGSQNIIGSAPEAVKYVRIKLPSRASVKSLISNKVKEKIYLEAQGEAVEISEEYPVPVLMAVFDMIHKVSPEMILRLKTGARVLVFEHWGAPILRDKDIQTVYKKMPKDKELKNFVSELDIDLGAIWRKRKAEEDDLGAIKKSLREIEGLIRPAMITTLIGEAPVLLFLLAQHLLFGKTGEVWYQKSKTSAPIKITQL